MRVLSLKNIFTDRNIAAFYLVLMNVQIVFIEGYTISPLKTIAMAISPIILCIRVPLISRALIIGILYWLMLYFSAIFHPESYRFSTLGYSGMFLLTYIMFYNIVYKGTFSIDFFIRLIKGLILAYGICLVFQQVSILVGIRFFPIINLNNQFFLSIEKLPSLSIEPSHTARILCVLFYSYLKCNEYKQGKIVTIKQLFQEEHRWMVLAFLWSMLTMGSGTAFICLGVLSLYFMKGIYIILAVPVFAGVYFLLSYFQVEQFERATSVAQVTLTGDVQAVAETDGSASTRIAPMLNTINNLDLSEFETWFGHGIDSGTRLLKDKKMIGEINDYGLVAYIMGLILVFSCAIRFRSLATIMYFAGIGGGTGNIAYAWGSLMVFTCVRYFYVEYKKENL